MGKRSDNLKKTKLYLKRNGIKQTVFAVTERLAMQKKEDYAYEEPEKQVLQSQREYAWETMPKISILVPAYETKQEYLKAMLRSVMNQTYSNIELVIADASESNLVQDVVMEEQDNFTEPMSLKYIRLAHNEGIADNTNEALREATGEYIGLLDHDDLLTPDACWYMAREIVDSQPVLLYSDEDKTNEDASAFFTPHNKKKFNLDLIITNNYICHFCVIRADIMKRLEFRDEYDGAQDYDMILRTIANMKNPREAVHIPRVLYHWRCHENSTAINPESKQYAYENGRRAVVDFCMRRGWNVTVNHSKHLGYYSVEYIPDIFTVRPEVGAVGGPVIKRGKIVSGAMRRDGSCLFAGLPKMYSGYMNRASLCQEVGAIDLRNLLARPELQKLYNEFCEELSHKDKSNDTIAMSLAFSEKVRLLGYRLVYDPNMKK